MGERDVRTSASAEAKRHVEHSHHVELLWLEKRIRTGYDSPRRQEQISISGGGSCRLRRAASSRSCRLYSNDFGTVISRIDYFAGCRARPALRNRAHVRPGGDVLLRLVRWPKSNAWLQIVDAVEALGIDPADAGA